MRELAEVLLHGSEFAEELRARGDRLPSSRIETAVIVVTPSSARLRRATSTGTMSWRLCPGQFQDCTRVAEAPGTLAIAAKVQECGRHVTLRRTSRRRHPALDPTALPAARAVGPSALAWADLNFDGIGALRGKAASSYTNPLKW